MKERNVTVTIDQAKEWFNSGNVMLKDVALQAFSKKELEGFDFTEIKSFEDALLCVCEPNSWEYDQFIGIVDRLRYISKASAAMFKLNIIRKVLNLGQDLHLTKDPKGSYLYYPYNPFVTKSSIVYERKLNSGRVKVIGKIKSEGEEYNVLGGDTCCIGGVVGLGSFVSSDSVGSADAGVAFLGCASQEIAQHLGKYFGMLIIEAKYADMADFEIIENKYQ